ncbi:MAG TPA: flagellin [Janthinobacterium sp.]|jgi:flagellin|nr:flagellin [Janthinobacterium sp.]
MLSLHTNTAALAAQNAINTNQASLATSQTRLSTGFRINSSQDDAAGLQIATRLQAQTSGMAVAMQNTQNSISMMQTADGALSETTAILTRMKDLATQAADGSSTAQDQTAMQAEFDTLTSQLSNIVSNTSFGGTNLLNSTNGTFAAAGGVQFQIGDTSAQSMTVDISTQVSAMSTALTAASAEFTGALTAAPTAAPTAGAELTSAASANAAIGNLSTAIDSVSTVRSALGANENSLQHTYNNLSNVSTNTTAATGRIMDTNFATESSTMTSDQMLLQAGTAMLKQSNSINSLVMTLLQ